MNNGRIRLSLLAGSVAVIFVDLFFLWILNLNEAEKIQQMLELCILILGGTAIAAVALFFIKGPVLNGYGQVETGNIMAMMVSVLVVIQLAFSFAAYSQQDQELRYEMYSSMRQVIAQLENCKDRSELKTVLDGAVADSDSSEVVEIIDSEGTVYVSSDERVSSEEMRSGDTKTADSEAPDAGNLTSASRQENLSRYEFPFLNDSRIVFRIDGTYRNRRIFDIWLNLLTTLAISVFFSVEMVWGMIGVVNRRNSITETKPAALYFVRQTAFLFYFASRMSAAFIPIMAKGLDSSFFGAGSNVAAGIPQSAETLLTCVAIFAATELLTRKGWKLPFAAGLGLVAFGTLLSAAAQELTVFIAARAIVGLGYGFCWMTLRNLALFGQDDKEKTWGFSMLNAGLYAGMNCGSALGSILAERFGYRNVFLIAAGLTVLCSLFIMWMENDVLPAGGQSKEKESGDANSLRIMEKLQVLSFSVFMIAPSCIVGAYLSYYLPLYYESIGRNVSDVGRAQLLYGLVIVYVGPYLSAKIIDKSGNLIWANLAYNITFAVGLIVAGALGRIAASLLAVLCLAVADSFGFGVQNNYFLALPAVASMNAGKSLSFLSFLKKITEMLGPIVYSMVILLGFERGLMLLGMLFLAAVFCYGFTHIFGYKRNCRV